MKNRIKSYWSNCLSIAAIICSVVAICVSLPSAPNLGFDYSGATEGILALLVTILIGWQIWNVIAIEKQIDSKIKQINNSITKSIETTKNEMIEYIQEETEKSQEEIAFSLFFIQGESYSLNKKHDDAFLCYLDAVSHSIKFEIHANVDNSKMIDTCLEKIRNILPLVDKTKIKRLKNDMKAHHIETLLKIDNNETKDIIVFLSELL